MITAAAFLTLGFETVKATPSELALFMVESQKVSAMVVLPNYDTISYENTSKSLDELVLPLKRDGYAGLQTSAAMLFNTNLPKSKLGVLRNLVDAPSNRARLTGQLVTIPETALANDALTFKTSKNEVVALSSLITLPFKRRLEVSAYFNGDGSYEFPIALNVNSLDGAEFAKLLGRGLGAKVVFDPKKITLAFDAATFRGQMAKVVAAAREGVNQDRKPGLVVQTNQPPQEFDPEGQYYEEGGRRGRSGPVVTAKPTLLSALNLLQTTIGQMTDNSLEQTFAYANTEMSLDLLRYPAISQAVVAYFQSLPTATTQPGGQSSARGARQGITSQTLSRVDRNNPGKVHITTDFKIRLELNLAGPQSSRPGSPTINVQVL